MQIIRFVPGAIVTPNAITLPTTAPDIDAVVGAEITRVPVGMCNLVAHTQAQVVDGIAVHAQVDIVDALADHPVHSHDLDSLGTGIAPTQPYGLDAVPVLEDAGAAALHTVVAAAATGVQDNAAQAHGDGTTPPPHTAGANPLVHGAGADPIVAAVPTRLTTRTFRLDVNTLAGDLVILSYLEVGERVLVS